MGQAGTGNSNFGLSTGLTTPLLNGIVPHPCSTVVDLPIWICYLLHSVAPGMLPVTACSLMSPISWQCAPLVETVDVLSSVENNKHIIQCGSSGALLDNTSPLFWLTTSILLYLLAGVCIIQSGGNRGHPSNTPPLSLITTCITNCYFLAIWLVTRVSVLLIKWPITL